jgi:hypothetical protein
MKSRPMDSLVRGMCVGLLALASLLAVALAHAGTPQAITFEPFENRTYGFGTVPLNATASSGLPVRYTSLTPDVCIIAAKFDSPPFQVPVYVSLYSDYDGSTCTIAADQPGDTVYDPTPRVTRSATVSRAVVGLRLLLTFNPTSDTYFSFEVVPYINPDVFLDLARRQVKTLLPTFFNVKTVNLTAALAPVPASFDPKTLSASSLTPDICEIGLPIVLSGAILIRPGPISTSWGLIPTGKPGTCTFRVTDLSGTTAPLEYSVPFVGNLISTLTSTQPVGLTGSRLGLVASVESAKPLPANATVQFFDADLVAQPGTKPVCDALLVSGRAVCEMSIPTGASSTRTFTARYAVDGILASSQARLAQPVSPITLGVSPQQTITGAPVRLLANLSPNATGTVTFAKDGVPLASCGAVPIIAGTTFKTAACFTTASILAARYTATYASTTMEVGVNVASVVAPDRTNHYWGGDAQNGWGLVVTQHGETPFVTLYIYDAQGKPDWLVMSGTWDNAKAQFTGDLFRPRGGPYSNYSAAKFEAGKIVGTASLVFQNYAGSQIVDLTYTLDGQNGAKAVSKLSISGPAGGPAGDLSDIWWNPTENGWGVSITHQNNAIFAVWFTYGTDGKPVWFPMPGGTWNGNTYTGKLYRTTSSPWLGVPYDATKLKASEIGTMSLKFLDGNTADMTYAVDGVTQTKTITRQPY